MTAQEPQDIAREEKSLDELTKEWVIAVEARLEQYDKAIPQINALLTEMAQAQHTIEERVAARIAKEELKILVDNASKGIEKGIAEAFAMQKEEWEEAMANFHRKVSRRYKNHILISIGIGIVTILICWGITVFGGVK